MATGLRIFQTEDPTWLLDGRQTNIQRFSGDIKVHSNACDPDLCPALQEESFPGTPQPLTPAQSALVPEKVQKLLDVFVDRGFAIKVLLWPASAQLQRAPISIHVMT